MPLQKDYTLDSFGGVLFAGAYHHTYSESVNVGDQLSTVQMGVYKDEATWQADPRAYIALLPFTISGADFQALYLAPLTDVEKALPNVNPYDVFSNRLEAWLLQQATYEGATQVA